MTPEEYETHRDEPLHTDEAYNAAATGLSSRKKEAFLARVVATCEERDAAVAERDALRERVAELEAGNIRRQLKLEAERDALRAQVGRVRKLADELRKSRLHVDQHGADIITRALEGK